MLASISACSSHLAGPVMREPWTEWDTLGVIACAGFGAVWLIVLVAIILSEL